jgi:hypothetical protein
LWAVGIRKDTLGVGEGSQGLAPLQTEVCFSLIEIMEPGEEGDTSGRLPAGQVAAAKVK